MLNRTDQKLSSRIVKNITVISFCLLLALFFSTPFFLMDTVLPTYMKIYRLYGYGLLFGLQFLLLLCRGFEKSKLAFITPVIAVLAWFCISVSWADHFDLSFRRVLLVFLIYFSVFSGVIDLGYKKTLDILRLFLVLVLTINIFTVFAFPDIGIQSWHSYHLWRGLLADKNIAGVASAVTVIVFIIDGKRIALYQRVLIICAAFLFLYMSWSRTALIASAAALAIGVLIPKIRHHIIHNSDFKRRFTDRYIWYTFAVSVLVLTYLTMQRDIVVSFTDNASGLSLRNSIWRPMIQYYLDHPILGAGYGSYWDASVNIESDTAYSTQKWLKNVDQGHNGYLDLLVQTGFFGLVLALWAAIAWPMTQFMTMVERQPDRAALTFSLLSFFMIENFTESSLFADDALGNLFIFFALAQVHRFKLRSGDQVRHRRDRSFDSREHSEK
ncbi:O-antigen ligase family protein [Sphingomonas faeni]|uniref:O-antigen ligase family protein n=1 Tax=Sphingomonas faeni TaxID=185950 RepID=UPI0020C81379|nr:O-antigen ligase family protein [Sphingomonas faeni]MCP8892828.1 O-antigen ligase family protein [Sphingomonas faeni]